MKRPELGNYPQILSNSLNHVAHNRRRNLTQFLQLIKQVHQIEDIKHKELQVVLKVVSKQYALIDYLF